MLVKYSAFMCQYYKHFALFEDCMRYLQKIKTCFYSIGFNYFKRIFMLKSSAEGTRHGQSGSLDHQGRQLHPSFKPPFKKKLV